MYVGATLTLQEQIVNLRALGDGGLTRKMSVFGALGAIFCGVWFHLAGHTTEEVFALFFGLCSLAVCTIGALAGPHFRNAAAATHKSRRERAVIQLHPGLDDEAREGSLHGVLRPAAPHAPKWKMDFVRADGWTPATGDLHVEAVYLSDVAWPVLLVHADGLLVPNRRPRRVD